MRQVNHCLREPFIEDSAQPSVGVGAGSPEHGVSDSRIEGSIEHDAVFDAKASGVPVAAVYNLKDAAVRDERAQAHVSGREGLPNHMRVDNEEMGVRLQLQERHVRTRSA
jgi:hypothetical protein